MAHVFGRIGLTALLLGMPLSVATSQPDDVTTQPAPETSSTPAAPQAALEPTATSDLVDGKSDYYARMTVPVTIEGEGPFRFMIDTGAEATVVTRGLTDKLGLRPIGSATVVGMASSKNVQLVELNGLEFAQRILDNIEAPLLEARNVGADGILGLDSLQDLRVLIDFRTDTIAVDDAEKLGGNRGYEIVVRARSRLGRLIITEAVIDGVKTSVILDTGAQTSFGNLKLKKRLRSRKRDVVSSTDVNGVQIVGDRHFVKTLKIQGVELQNMPITFADSPAFAALELEKRPALILGMRDLRLFDRIAIDFESRRVLFDLPPGSRKRQLIQDNFFPSRVTGG